MRKQSVNLKIFISSVQKEFAAERRALKTYLTHDPLLSRFIDDVFLFEDVPACNQRPDELYLPEVGGCDVYLALLGSRMFGGEFGLVQECVQVGEVPRKVEDMSLFELFEVIALADGQHRDGKLFAAFGGRGCW